MNELSDDTLETSRILKIAVVGVGGISRQKLLEYTEVMRAHSKIELSNFGFITANEFPFHSIAWQKDSVELDFRLDVPTPIDATWHNLYLHKKIYGVIGVMHCASQDNLTAAHAEFLSYRQHFTSCLRSRCFAFEPLESQADMVELENLIMFPNQDASHLQFYMSTIVMDFASFLVQDLATKVNEYASMVQIPCTPLDSSDILSVDAHRRKRLLQGRISKHIADIALLCGSPRDAQHYYHNARESAKSTSDFVWYAASHEGLAACALALHTEQCVCEAAVERLEKAQKMFARKTTAISLQLNVFLKNARYHINRGVKIDGAHLLMCVYELSSTLSCTFQVKVCVEVALMFKHIGFMRKFAIFIREAAMLYSELKDWTSCHALSSLIAPVYGLPARIHDQEPLSADKRIGSCWISLQRSVLEELVVSAKSLYNHRRAVYYLAILLGNQFKFITPNDQRVLVCELMKSSSALALNHHIPMSALPIIDAFRILDASTHTQPLRRYKNDTKSSLDESVVKDQIFLFRPNHSVSTSETAEEDAIVVGCGQLITVSVCITNPLSVKMDIASICVAWKFHTHINDDEKYGALQCESLPCSLHLMPHSSSSVHLSLTPLEVGELSIVGVNVRMWNIDSLHKPSESTHISRLMVVPSLPFLKLKAETDRLQMLIGEERIVRVFAHNQSHVDINNFAIEIEEHSNGESTSMNDALCFTHDATVCDQILPLVAGVTATISLKISARSWCNGATVVVRYAESDDTLWCRKSAIRIPLDATRGIVVQSIDIVTVDNAITSQQSDTQYHDRNEQLSFANTALTLANLSDDECILVCEVSNTADTTIQFSLIVHDDDVNEHNAVLAFIEAGNNERLLFPLSRRSFGSVNDDALLMKNEYREDSVIEQCRQLLFRRLRLTWTSSLARTGSVCLSNVNVTAAMLKRLIPDPIVCHFRLTGNHSPVYITRRNSESILPLNKVFSNHNEQTLSSHSEVLTRQRSRSVCVNTSNFTPSTTSLNTQHSPSSNFYQPLRFYPIAKFKKIFLCITNHSLQPLMMELDVKPSEEIAQGELTFELQDKLLWTGCLHMSFRTIAADETIQFECNVCFLTIGRFQFQFILRYRGVDEACEVHSHTLPLLIESINPSVSTAFRGV